MNDEAIEAMIARLEVRKAQIETTIAVLRMELGEDAPSTVSASGIATGTSVMQPLTRFACVL